MTVRYTCPACFNGYDTLEALDKHRSTIHGRDVNGNLTISTRSPVDSRIAELEQLAAAIRAEFKALQRKHERLHEAAQDAVGEYYGSGQGMVSELAHAMECLQARLKES